MGDNMHCMRQLPASTVRLIASSQVITSVVSVVKELVENSLDANSSSIEIKLENYGFDKVEVRDNGDGIRPSDAPYMAQPHYTSKITSSEDLQHLTSYGFRGEALGSLCAVSRVSITTKTREDQVGMTYDVNFNGQIVTSKPTHLGQGTTLTAVDLFKNLPVRRQFYSTVKKRREELKKVEDLIVAYSVVRHDVRFVLRHNKDTIWMKNPVAAPRDVLLRVFGSPVMSNMEHIRRRDQDTEIDVDMYIPRATADFHLTSRASTEKCFIFVNKRPVILKELEKVLKQYYCNALKCDGRYPLVYLSIVVPSDAVDVNVDPNKTKVMIHEKAELLTLLGDILSEIYGPLEKKAPNKKEGTLGAPPDDGMDDGPAFPSLDTTPEFLVDAANKENLPEASGLKISFITSDINDDSLPDQNLGNSKDSSFQGDSEASLQVESARNVEDNTHQASSNDSSQASMQKLEPAKIPEETVSLPEQSSNTSQLLSTQNAFDLLTDEFATSTPLDSLLEQRVDTGVNCPLSTETPQVEQLNAASHLSSSDDAEFEKLAADLFDSMNDDDFDITDGPSTKETPACPQIDMARNDSSSSCSVAQIGVNDVLGTDVKKEQPWSLGTSLKQSDGKPLQPVTVLQPITSFLSPSSSSDSARTPSFAPAPSPIRTPQHKTTQKKVVDSPGQTTLYEMMGDQPLKRPSTAFIHFCKAIRPQVYDDHPGATFNEVARIVGERWKALSSDERHQYELLTAKEKERYRARLVAEAKNGSQASPKPVPAPKRRKLSNGQSSGNPSTQELILDEVVAQRKSKTVPFSLDNLRNMFDKINTSSDVAQESMNLIGNLRSHDVWLGCHDNHIMLIHPARAQEMIIYRRLLSNHALPMESTENNIVLQPSLVGGDDSWQLLQRLTQSRPNGPDPFTYITDDRLIKNGFRLRLRKDPSDGRVHMEITGMTKCLNFFGLSDLQEVLSIILKNPGVSLEDCRPGKVKHFLQAEAVRMARKLPQSVSHQEVKDIHRQIMKRLSNNHSNQCFHRKPYLLSLYNMDDLPVSQDSQVS